MYTRDVGRSSRFDYGKTIYAVLWSLKECYCFEPFWILYCFPLDVIGKICFGGRGRNISTYTSTFGWTVCLCGWRSIIGSFLVSLHLIKWIVVTRFGYPRVRVLPEQDIWDIELKIFWYFQPSYTRPRYTVVVSDKHTHQPHHPTKWRP